MKEKRFMNNLKIENLCDVIETKNTDAMINITNLYNVEESIETYTISNYVKIDTHHVQLNKDIKNSNFIKEAIDLMIENNMDDKDVDEELLYKMTTLNIYDIKDLRKDITSFFSILSANAASISSNSRIAYGNAILLPLDFLILDNIFMNTSSYFNVYYTEYLTDKIIVFIDNEQYDYKSTFKLIKNEDKYTFLLDKNYNRQYNIINIKSKKQSRINKINRLIKKYM